MLIMRGRRTAVVDKVQGSRRLVRIMLLNLRYWAAHIVQEASPQLGGDEEGMMKHKNDTMRLR